MVIALDNELEGLFWRELVDILHCEESLVRRAWNVNGAPDWSLDEDVLFLQISEEAGADIVQPVDTVFEENEDSFIMHQGQTRVLRVSLVAYGPNCYKNLRIISLAFLNGREAIRNNKIYIIPGTDVPIYAPELFQSRWWKRADLTLRFNSLMRFESDIKPIEVVTVDINANKEGSSQEVISETGIIIKKG